MDYYFSDENYYKDEYMRSKEDANGWIPIEEFLNWQRMKAMRANFGHVQDAAFYSLEFELDNKFKDTIRKQRKDVDKNLKGLGFDHEGIRNMNQE